jgi:hypothetical protein
MVLETAQLLCSPFEPDAAPYKRTHYNHPCSIWARSSMGNYLWLLSYGMFLAKEYEKRYNKIHKSLQVIKWCSDNLHRLHGVVPAGDKTDPPQCMPDQYKCDNTVQAYINYYHGEKASFAQWKKGNIPHWWKNNS